jgi:hypothetical protein
VISANCVGAVSEHLVLAREWTRLDGDMPDIGESRGGRNGPSFSPAADQYGNLAHWRWSQLRHATSNALERVDENLLAAGRCAEIVAIQPIVGLVPASSKTQDQSPITDVINRSSHVRQQIWVAEAGPANE